LKDKAALPKQNPVKRVGAMPHHLLVFSLAAFIFYRRISAVE